MNHRHPGRADRARVLCNPRRGTFNQSMRKLSCGSGGRFSIVSSSLESKSPIIMLGVSGTEGIQWFLIMVGHVFQFLYHIYICLTAKRLSWKGVKKNRLYELIGKKSIVFGGVKILIRFGTWNPTQFVNNMQR